MRCVGRKVTDHDDPWSRTQLFYCFMRTTGRQLAVTTVTDRSEDRCDVTLETLVSSFVAVVCRQTHLDDYSEKVRRHALEERAPAAQAPSAFGARVSRSRHGHGVLRLRSKGGHVPRSPARGPSPARARIPASCHHASDGRHWQGGLKNREIDSLLFFNSFRAY